MRFRAHRRIPLLIFFICSTLILIYFVCKRASIEDFEDVDLKPMPETSRIMLKQFYQQRKNWKTSNLGSILFKNVDAKKFRKKEKVHKTFIVLIWKYYNWLRQRHIRGFSKERLAHPLNDCSVKNCVFIGNDSQIRDADAVVIHLQHGLFPHIENRNLKQRWIFLTDEAPPNTFSLAPDKSFTKQNLVDVFNWSMSYRIESDIPVPYGRVIPLPAEDTRLIYSIIPYWNYKRSNVVVSILVSNCLKYRMNYVNELKKYIAVDVFGKCSTDLKNETCPGHFRNDCQRVNEYFFYLAFENSECKEYFTEKVYHNAFSKGAVPIIMGPSRYDCDKLLPPSSYIHIDNYNSPKELAEFILHLSQNHQELVFYHAWRKEFEVVNEHGFFGTKSKHMCRICEALNYNDDASKVYTKKMIDEFFDAEVLCRRRA